MYQVIYTSAAIEEMDVNGLSDLLRQSRENNKETGITGLLVYKNGSFMQAFEGEEEDVRALYDTIKDDDRHHGVITLSQETIDSRNFADWSMGFKHLGDVDPRELPEGFFDLFSPDFDPDTLDVEPSYAREALLGFKEASL